MEKIAAAESVLEDDIHFSLLVLQKVEEVEISLRREISARKDKRFENCNVPTEKYAFYTCRPIGTRHSLARCNRQALITAEKVPLETNT